jgi:hypothetical protein
MRDPATYFINENKHAMQKINVVDTRKLPDTNMCSRLLCMIHGRRDKTASPRKETV